MIQNFFYKKELPEEIPVQLAKIANELSKIRDREDILSRAYEIITNKYYGRRLETFLNMRKMFEKDIYKIWKEKGFYQCTTLNYLLRVLLVNSGRFEDSELKQINTLIWLVSPHQYLQVTISDKKVVFVDPWSKAYGIKYGNFASGFHSGSLLKQF